MSAWPGSARWPRWRPRWRYVTCARALQLADRFGPRDQELRCELLLELAGAHDRAGEYASRDERFAEAADAARHLGTAICSCGPPSGTAASSRRRSARPAGAKRCLRRRSSELGKEDSAARATILARLAHWLHNERPYPERLELSDRSLAMARGTGDRRTLATVLTHRGWALDGPDDVADALAVASEILAVGAELGDPELRLEGLRIRVTAQFEKGEHRAATATALAMKELAEEVRHPEFMRLAAMWDVTLANLEGRFADAKELADELGRRLARIGHSQAQIIPVAQTFPWWVLRDARRSPCRRCEELSAYEPANIAWPAITAWCLAETGALDRAADLLRRTEPAAAAAADKNYQWWAVIVGFSGAVDLVGDRQWAEVLYDLAAPYAGRNCTLGVATFLGAADHWLGVLAGVAGRFTEATRHLEAALARHRDMGSRPLTALTQDAYGRCCPCAARQRTSDGHASSRRPRCARPRNSGWRRSADRLSRRADAGPGCRDHGLHGPRYGRPRNSAIRGYTSSRGPGSRQSRRGGRTRAAPSAGSRPAGSASGASARS